MNNFSRPGQGVLIVGAGAMGIVTGFHLQLSGADVTHLVRPHRLPVLRNAQLLYDYNSASLKHYSGYNLITSIENTAGGYRFVLITLDGLALKSPSGIALAEALGAAFRGTDTTIIIGTVGVGLRSWFLSVSGLSADQVIVGSTTVMSHPVSSVSLPLHPPTDASLLAQADLAYTHNGDRGFIVSDDAPVAARQFADLYDASIVSTCEVMEANAFALMLAGLFPVFLACDIVGWPDAEDIDTGSEPWALATAAVREIQGLPMFGKAGQAAKVATTAEALASTWRGWQAATLPMDLQAFNRFHHGGKVVESDLLLLRDCLAFGEAEGYPMPELIKLIARWERHRAAADQLPATTSA